jgi:hypothetical protein
VKFVAVNADDAWITVPAVPDTVSVAGVIAAWTMANVTVAVAPTAPSLAVTVTVAVEAAVGVPEITPVEESSDNPAGNDPVGTEYVMVPGMFAGVKAVDAVTAEPTVPEMVCVDGVTDDDVVNVLPAPCEVRAMARILPLPMANPVNR